MFTHYNLSFIKGRAVLIKNVESCVIARRKVLSLPGKAKIRCPSA